VQQRVLAGAADGKGPRRKEQPSSPTGHPHRGAVLRASPGAAQGQHVQTMRPLGPFCRRARAPRTPTPEGQVQQRLAAMLRRRGSRAQDLRVRARVLQHAGKGAPAPGWMPKGLHANPEPPAGRRHTRVLRRRCSAASDTSAGPGVPRYSESKQTEALGQHRGATGAALGKRWGNTGAVRGHSGNAGQCPHPRRGRSRLWKRRRNTDTCAARASAAMGPRLARRADPSCGLPICAGRIARLLGAPPGTGSPRGAERRARRQAGVLHSSSARAASSSRRLASR